MDRSFTPLNIKKLEKKYGQTSLTSKQSGFESSFNTVLLLLATITALVAIVVLYLMIQKQMKTRSLDGIRRYGMERVSFLYV